MAQYELVILGSPTIEQQNAVTERMASTAADFGMSARDGLAVRTASTIGARNIMASTVALYFGGDPAIDADPLATLLAARIPVVPVLADSASVSATIPPALRAINACFVDPLDTKLEAVCALALECLGLLHEQRSVFVSYRRDDSRKVAIQLHDDLSSKGFDVFLDTHSIRPGAVFQEMLWHRLADCDVVVMLDTAGYFDSKWTKQELGRSMAHGIHVLRLVWPEHKPTRFIDLSDTVRLKNSDFDATGRLEASLVATVIAKTEALRSRSVAWRHRNLVAKLRTEVLSIGGAFGGVGAHHSVPIDLPNGLKVQAYPAVGVPTALLLNDIHRKAAHSARGRRPCLIYDDAGLRPAWLDHLTWLDANISEVRAVKVVGAGGELAGWDS